MASLINFTIPSILSIRLKKWTNSWLNYMLIGIKRSEEHTSELQSRSDLVCRLLLEKKKNIIVAAHPFKTLSEPETAVKSNVALAPGPTPLLEDARVLLVLGLPSADLPAISLLRPA